MTKGLVSIVLPSRNEPYLEQTIKSLLKNAEGDMEIYAILDGAWEETEKIVDDPRVNYIYFSEARGMRAGINAGVAVSRGEFLLKLDAHCDVGKGYDEILKQDCKDDWVVVPRRYPLIPETWSIEERTDNKYPLDYQYLSKDLHGKVWKARDLLRKNIMIDETPSSQGSCWFMKRSRFEYLELMDDKTYGIFWSEFQEIGLKNWLSGGKCMVNKRTWYSHWHKTSSRGYSLPKDDKEKTEAVVAKWLEKEKFWHKQKYDLMSFFKERFPDMPGW